MALWRFGRGWSEPEMKAYLAELRGRDVNFAAAPDQMTPENGWTVDGAEAPLGREAMGAPVPDGLFLRARQGLINYDFSDPRIAQGHFDPQAELVDRDMLLEIKVFGLRFLNGVRVTYVRDEQTAEKTVFGFRYDTLKGHIERGAEWFLLDKDHRTGEINFRIEARWQPGDFPNWWSRLGFLVVGGYFRKIWRRRAPGRLRQIARQPHETGSPPPGKLAHRGKETPKRSKPPS